MWILNSRLWVSGIIPSDWHIQDPEYPYTYTYTYTYTYKKNIILWPPQEGLVSGAC